MINTWPDIKDAMKMREDRESFNKLILNAIKKDKDTIDTYYLKKYSIIYNNIHTFTQSKREKKRRREREGDRKKENE